MERYINIVDYHQRKNNKQVFFAKDIVNLPVCRRPWADLVINQYGIGYICASPAWLPKGIGSVLDYDNIFDMLNSHEARAIRSEVSLNRYSYCNHKICGYIPQQIETVPDAQNTILLTENQFTATSTVNYLPSRLCFDFDYTCNFKCPSCRTKMINHNRGPMYDTNKLVVNQIKKLLLDEYAKTNSVVQIRWAGGEPLVSKAYLDLWKYIAKLGNTTIRNTIQTNGSYLIKRSKILKDFLPYIDEVRISFDAGTAETYKKIRVNGKWSDLIKNCKYLKELINQLDVKVILHSDFIVQLDNYLEIPQYIETAKSLGFNQIGIGKMWNWNTWSMEEFDHLNISDPTHPKHTDLLVILEKYKSDPIVDISV